jgi:hypothetical protein
MPNLIYGPKSKWYNVKLEDWPDIRLVVWLCVSAAIAAPLAKLLFVYYDFNFMTPHGAITLMGTLHFVMATAVALVIAGPLVFCSLLAARTGKVLGERWFP